MKNILAGLGVIAVFFLLLSCSKDYNDDTATKDLKPLLLSLSLSSDKNSEVLLEDVKGEIIGDSIVECWVPYLMPHKKLYVDIECLGGAKINGSEYNSKLKYDFSNPVILAISNEGVCKEYIVNIHAFTGLPVLWVETEQRAEILSREEYVPAYFKLVDDISTRSAEEEIEFEGKIRGRGNSTWFQPKRPYRIKLNEKISLLGEHKDKKWNLLANHFDRTLIRNALAFYMGSISGLDYTPKSHFVELMLNGRYDGTYQLTEALSVSNHRINIGDDGYLLEIDNHIRDYEIGFRTTRLPWPIRIHEPEVGEGDLQYQYICDLVNKIEDVLYSDNFLDKSEGYAKYIDKRSFAEWYVINEILQNATAADNGYMTYTKNGKLKMGPLWDFDLSIGNNPWDHIDKVEAQSVDPKAFWAKNYHWYPRLFQDPEFVNLVKERFVFFYLRKEELFSFINGYANYLKRSAQENDNRWNVLYTPLSVDSELMNIWGSYDNEVQFIKNYLLIRFEWLKQEFDKM